MAGTRRIAPVREPSLLERTLSSISVFNLLSSHSVHEFLSTWAFKTTWITILGVQFSLGIARFITAVFHILLADPEAYAAVTMIQIPRGVLMATGLSMGAVAALHFGAVAFDLTKSCKAGRLTFANSSQPSGPSISVVPDGPGILSVQPLRRRGLVPTFGRYCYQVLVRPVDYVDNLFGVNGRYFFQLVNTLETIKVVTQTYQAYQLSLFVYSKPVNSFIVAMIFLTCTLPSIMIYLTETKRRGTQRLVVLVIDLVLDIIYAEAIPGLVLLPIITEYDWKIRAFAPEMSFNNVWANNSVAQTRYVLVVSYLDLATTLVPHFNFLMGVHLLKKLLHRRSDVLAVIKNSPQTTLGTTVQDSPAQPNQIFRDWKSRLYRGAMVCWGIFVVGLHVGAQHQDTTIPGCKMPLAPWHLKRGKLEACAVMHLNCYRFHYTGDESEIDAVLSRLDRDALTTITFTHCPKLQLPPMIVRFPRLIGIEFFNSSIVKWGADAAVTAQSFNSLHHVFFFATNMTIFPAALTHSDLPKSLQYLAIYGSNLAYLPASLGDVWGAPHQWRVFSLIDTAVKELPGSFAKVHVDVLQLIGNSIERLPVEMGEQFGSYQKLRLSGRDFHELPSEPSPFRDVRLRRLYVVDSNVSSIPEWLVAWLDASLAIKTAPQDRSPWLERVSFHGSSLCGQAEYIKYSRFCKPDLEFDLDNFPFEAITAQWEL